MKEETLTLLYTLASSKPQVVGDVSPGLTSLKRKNLPIVVTLGEEGVDRWVSTEVNSFS